MAVRLPIAILLTTVCLSTAFAQKPGDKVIAKGDVTLRLSNKIVETVAQDTVLNVEKTNGDWLWVRSPSGKSGWVKNTEVVEAPPDLPTESPKAQPTEKSGEKRPTVAGTGTAFVVHPDGYLVTNAHVVKPWKEKVFRVEESSITVSLNGKKHVAKLLVIDPVRDLALLKIEATGLQAIPLGDSDSVELNEPVHAFGFPRPTALGASLKVNPGAVTGIDESARGKALQTSATINKGNSGGPLVNSRGEAVGVVVAVWDFEADVGVCIPANYIRQLAATGGVELPKPSPSGTLDAVKLVKRVSPSVAMVYMDALQWSFNVDLEPNSPNAGAKNLSFSPGSDTIAIGSEKSLAVWDYRSFRPLTRFDLATVKSPLYSLVYEIAFSPDGGGLAWIGGTDGQHLRLQNVKTSSTIKMWDFEDDRLRHSLDAPNETQDDQSAGCLAFSPDGKFFVTGTEFSGALIWNAASGRIVHRLRTANNDEIRQVRFSPDGRLVATRDKALRIRVWDATNGALRFTLADADKYEAFAFASDSSKIIALVVDGPVKVFNSMDGRTLNEFRHGLSASYMHRVTKGGVDYVLLRGHRDLGLFDLIGQVKFRFESTLSDDQASWLDAVAVSPDGDLIATGHDGWVTLRKVDGLLRRGELKEGARSRLEKAGVGFYSSQFGGMELHLSSKVILTDENWEDMRSLNVFGDLGAIVLYENHQLTDAIWNELVRFPSIHTIRSTSKKRASLSGISKLPNLSIFEAHLADDDLGRLSDSSLERLDLEGSPVTDRGLEHVAKMKSLIDLGLGGTAISDIGLAQLSNLKSLMYLDLTGTSVTDAGLVHLQELSNLTSLEVRKTSVSGAKQLLTSIRERKETAARLEQERRLREQEEAGKKTQRAQDEFLKELDRLLKGGTK